MGRRQERSGGRSRSRAAARLLRSFGEIGVFVLTAIPAGSERAQSRMRRAAASTRAGVHRYVVMALDRRDGRVVWEQDRARGSAARSLASGQRHLGVGIGDDRRAARDRVVRVARHLRVRHERQARLGEGSRRQVDAQRVRRGQHAGSLPAIASSSSGITRRARSSPRSTRTPATSCGASRRDEIDTWATPYVVEHAGRAQVIVPGMNRLHSYDLETGEVVWHRPGTDDEPDSVAGWRGRDRHRDERLPRQQPQGHPNRRRERRSHGLEGHRLVARSRHAVRAVAASVRRLPVSA